MERDLFAELKTTGITPKTRKQVADILLSGPPPAERKTLWLEITGAGYELRENPSYYKKLIADKQSERNIFVKQIDRDLHRTFSNEAYVSQSHLKSLRNILIAYAVRNPCVGYCQGLNFIVGRLLTLNFNEEEAFWMLCQIIEIYLPIDYFSLMIGVLVDQKVFEFFLQRRLPKMFMFLSSLDIDVSLYSVQWFVCIFAYTFQRDVSIRIWDTFFVKGNRILFSVALSILHIHRKQLLAIREFDVVLKFIDSACKHIENPELILNVAFHNKKFMIDSAELRKLREDFRTEVEEELDKRVDVVLPEDLVMRTLSHFCDSEDECQQKIRRTSSFFNFTSSVGMFIRDDYIDDECIPKQFNTSQLREVQDYLLTGAKNHLCSYEMTYAEKPDLEEFVSVNRTTSMNKSREPSRSFAFI